MPPIPSFHVVGVSHHTASVQEREQFAFSPRTVASALEQFRQERMAALLLSTCNRCELYWWGTDDGQSHFLKLAEMEASPPSIPLRRYDGMAAVRHLFLVSAGLDSQILGESEILGQVRRAFEGARAAGATNREMDLIFSAALCTGRRVRRDTIVGRHAGSVSSAAVELGRQQVGEYRDRKVVVLGAGEAAEGVLRALQDQGSSRVTLVNRHPEKARALASAWGAEAGSWEELDQRLLSADLLLVATASTHPVVTADQLQRAVQSRANRPLLVMDLAMPRNVEPAARAIRGIELLDLDDLQRLCCPAGGVATAALAEAEAIVEDELLRLALSLHSRLAAPQLADLHRVGLQLAEEESARVLSQLESLSASEQEVVRQMAERLVRRVLYPVSRSLRESGVAGESPVASRQSSDAGGVFHQQGDELPDLLATSDQTGD
jgi:glutamyl-tRNA reductase